jgi:DnaJ-class molecular chaperone
MSRFPAGAEHDPDAPYNEKPCFTCKGTGEYAAGTCPSCDGDGVRSPQQERDDYESFKEDTRDE